MFKPTACDGGREGGRERAIEQGARLQRFHALSVFLAFVCVSFPGEGCHC